MVWASNSDFGWSFTLRFERQKQMSQNRGFYIALTIFLIPILVITLSTAWYYLGFGPKTKVNYGDLIEPKNLRTYMMKFLYYLVLKKNILDLII